MYSTFTIFLNASIVFIRKRFGKFRQTFINGMPPSDGKRESSLNLLHHLAKKSSSRQDKWMSDIIQPLTGYQLTEEKKK